MKKILSLALALMMLLALAVPAYAEQATATGTGKGIDGDVIVEVTADENTIYSIVVTQQNETPGIGSVAVEKLPGAMVEANTIEVDGITGATVTTTAIKTAVAEALTSLGFDPASYTGAAAADAAPAAKEEVALETGIVVIGAGGAGMTAAITAKDAGADVIVLESTAFPGGNSVRSTGGMNAGPTEWRNMNEFKEAAGVEATLKKVANYPDNERIQELGKIVEEQWAAYQAAPEGYFDTSELFQLDTMIGGGGMNDPALVKKLVESSPDAIAWLDSLDPAIILHDVAAFGGASVKRIHRPVDENGKSLSVGAYVVPLLQENLEKRGITLMTDTPATEILVDNGTVVGVKAEDAGHVYTITAKAVVIAAGGFGANNDMIKAVRPELDGFITTNAPGIQGQGIRWPRAIGAATVDMEQISSTRPSMWKAPAQTSLPRVCAATAQSWSTRAASASSTKSPPATRSPLPSLSRPAVTPGSSSTAACMTMSRLHHLFLLVGIHSHSHTGRTRQTDARHLSDSTTAQFRHLCYLHKMLTQMIALL